MKTHRLLAVLGELRSNLSHKLCRKVWSEWRSELTEMKKGHSDIAKWQGSKLSRAYYSVE